MKKAYLLSILCLLSFNAYSMENDAEFTISNIELEEIFNNPTLSYVCLSKEVSSLVEIISYVCSLDENQDSPVHAFKKHSDLGYVIARSDAVMATIHYAQEILKNNENNDDLMNTLNIIQNQIAQETITLDAQKLAFLKDSVVAHENATEEGTQEEITENIALEE